MTCQICRLCADSPDLAVRLATWFRPSGPLCDKHAAWFLVARRDVTRICEHDDPIMHCGPAVKAVLSHRVLDEAYDGQFDALVRALVMAGL